MTFITLKFNIIALNSIWIQFLDNEICAHTTDTLKLYERITCEYMSLCHTQSLYKC